MRLLSSPSAVIGKSAASFSKTEFALEGIENSQIKLNIKEMLSEEILIG